MDQWNTAVSVTRPMVVSEIHFQKTTSSLFRCDLTFDFVSMLNICSCRDAIRAGARQETVREGFPDFRKDQFETHLGVQ